MITRGDEESVWRALADASRREILDLLAAGPRTTGEVCDSFELLCRTAVMKHLDVLVAAGLVLVRREGRVRWNHLNAAPIQSIVDRWVSRHVQRTAAAVVRLKAHVERAAKPGSTRGTRE